MVNTHIKVLHFWIRLNKIILIGLMELQNTKMIQRICIIFNLHEGNINVNMVGYDIVNVSIGHCIEAWSSSKYLFWDLASRSPLYLLSSSSYLLLSGPGSRSRSWVLVVSDGWFQDIIQDLWSWVLVVPDGWFQDLVQDLDPYV